MVNLEMSNMNQAATAIAVIGLAGRFPGADTVTQFWQHLCQGKETITRFSEAELRAAGIDATLLARPNYVKAGAVLSDVETFDAAFFGFSPREAELMDPQHRLLLECAWTALEDAGYPPPALTALTGVFVGSNLSHYLLKHLASDRELLQSQTLETLIGNDKDYLATRISYLLNLKGPSLSVGTACSTSLVAVHLACRSLLGYQCDMAIAGGISLQSLQPEGYLHQPGSIASPDGHCRAFDAQAEGTVFGSGLGLVVLKRLAAAVSDGDHIYGVIRGSAINNDGAEKVAYTAPSVEGQADVVAEALAIAEVDSSSISYIEAHGTGTALGDPIEIKALNRVFQPRTAQTQRCAIGSVKTNVGHLNAAAGVTGLIKTLLALKHQQLPPSLHFQQPNPHIDFANSPFYVNTQLTDWQANGTPRRAGVSSFGIGGTNAHVVLEEAPPSKSAQPSRRWQLLLLSAKTETALETATANLATHLQQASSLNLADTAYTLQVGRAALAYRRLVVCQSSDRSAEVASVLKSGDPHRVLTGKTTGEQRAIAFLLPGQGAQYPGMAKELYTSEPTFRAVVDQCCQLLTPQLDIDLRSLLFADHSAHHAQQLHQTRWTQPALFVIEYALAQLWMHWGVQPSALLGHSLGELVAACLAGIFTLEAALQLVVLRADLMQQCPPGAMLSVPLSAAALQPWLSSEITLAVSNAPSLSVVAGTEAAIAALAAELATQGTETHRLQTSHGFHSPLMAPAVRPFVAAVQQVALHPPQIPLLSNVTGTWLTDKEATDPHYWGQQLRQSVQFAAGIHNLVQDTSQILLEVGPGRTLTTLAKQQAAAAQLLFTSLRHPQQAVSDGEYLLQTLGQLWLAGVAINWSNFYEHEQRQRLSLPTYPFERQRYWIEAGASSPPTVHSLDRRSEADWFYLPSWRRAPRLTQQSEAVEAGCWLVFLTSASSFVQPLLRLLEQAGQTVIQVTPAAEFTQLGDRQYSLNPHQPEDYETLLQTVMIRHATPQRVLYGWSLSSQGAEDTVLADAYTAFYGLISLTQAIAKHLAHVSSLQINVLTSGLHDVVGTESVSPEQAAILGACKVIPQEYPHLTCRHLDGDGEPSAATLSSLLPSLLAELLTPPTALTVAYRGAHRWVQTFEPLSLPSTPEASRLRRGGVYLIAGDLVNGLGFAIAQALIETWQAQVALVGQSDLPERHLWQQWLTTHAETDAVSRRIAQIQALEQGGGQILLLAADLTNADQMQRAIAQIDQQFGTLHGVIYTPAINAAQATRSIAELTRANSAAEIESRLQGLQVLEQSLQHQSLDFYLVQSSLACVLGGPGLAAYTASYSCLDAAVTQRCHTRPTPWFCLNRQAWYAEWDADLSTPSHLTSRKLAMTPAEVWAAMQRVLAMPGPGQVVASTAALEARLAQATQPSENPDGWQQLRSRTHTRPTLSNRYEPPQTELEQAIAAVWQALLGLEPIGLYDNFFELGGHSLLAIQVISRLREQFQVELPLKSILFEAPTVAGLAKVIAAQTETVAAEQMQQLLSEIEKLSPEEVQARLTPPSSLSQSIRMTDHE